MLVVKWEEVVDWLDRFKEFVLWMRETYGSLRSERCFACSFCFLFRDIKDYWNASEAERGNHDDIYRYIVCPLCTGYSP